MKIYITITDEKGNHYEGDAELSPSHAKRTKNIQTEHTNKKKPAYPIHHLYIENFFKEQKKLGDVSNRLKSDGFNFKAGSIQYALDNADYLDRTGGKGNYRWIQKYPPV
ncbi:MAG: hypothetical protein WEC35_05535 [Nitrosopumilaceae archaeon]